MSEVLYIAKCLRLIERKVKLGSSRQWTYEDYKIIQKLIFEASSINLSTHTLERLYGKLKIHKNYKPQADTKNALAVFLGYADWENFKVENPINSKKSIELTEPNIKSDQSEPGSDDVLFEPILNENENYEILTPVTRAKFRFGKKPKIQVSLFLAALSILVLAFVFARVNRKPAQGKITFKVENPLGAAPHTAKFIHDLSGLQGDNFSIIVSGNTDTLKLSKTQKFSYRTLLSPGWFTAYLLSDKKIIAKSDFYVKTAGWRVEYFAEGHRWPLPQAALGSAGKLYTPQSLLPDSLKKKYNYYLMSYSNIREFNVSGDNMSFETRFRNTLREGNQLCNDMWFQLFGTAGVIKIHFLTIGCTGYVTMTFGEKKLMGSMQNLNPMGIDIQNWRKARLEVINKNVYIYVDGSLIYKTNYSRSLGPIIGIEVSSKTSGETDYVKLYNFRKELVYEDDFGGKAID